MANSLLPPKLYVDTDAAVFTGTCYIKSITISNEVGAATKVIIYDNTAASGHIVVETEILDQTSVHYYYGERGMQMDIGIYVDLVANTHVIILMA